nr:PREDICTED: transcription factor E2F5-like [Paralichthys olivaceus]XP_019954355.1 PREDICTED: transcription factor E2F5-like [Paralichthys olivaceus]
MEPDEEAAAAMSDQASGCPGRVKSLHVLTTKFVELMQQSEGGLLDLRDAIGLMAIGQKRRIYDIINVLEGIGLIRRMSKRIVKWIGTMPEQNDLQLNHRLTQLKLEVRDLEQMEFMLDLQRLWVEQSIRNMTEDCSNLTYVNHEDICNCFSGHTLLAVRAPPGTQLDVPIPKATQNSPAKYQIHMKSISGPIDVVLLNRLSAGSAPVVLPVPPPEEILRNAKIAMSSHVTESSAKSRQAAIEDMQHHHASPLINTELNRMRSPLLRNLSKELRDLLDPSKEIMNTQIITKLVTSEVISSLFRAPPPPPAERENLYNLDGSENLFDLYSMFDHKLL